MNTLRLGRRLALREWLVLCTLLLALAAWLGSQNGVGRIDFNLYDQFLSNHILPQNAHGRIDLKRFGGPAEGEDSTRHDIIIVAIDDYSLAEIGRWPWPRSVHAQLLKRLASSEPLSIGLDVILTEPDGRENAAGHADKDLAESILEAKRVVLPVITSERGKGLAIAEPVETLMRAHPALGHINLQHDSDGVVRSVFLHEGPRDNMQGHFSLAMLEPALQTIVDSKINTFDAPQVGSGPGAWEQHEKMLIPFLGDSALFRSVPYVSVLRGEVPDQFFKGKYVLIGATALGMRDAYPTPVSGKYGAMPGVEINANILASLIDHRSIVLAKPWQTMALAIAPVFLAMLSYLLLSPRTALIMGGVLTVCTLAVSYTWLRLGLWIPPAAGVMVLILSYPLWSWRRLEAAIAYLGQEFIRLDQEPHLLPEPEKRKEYEAIEDVLERRIRAMSNAALRVRDLRQFVSDSLNSLPDATLVTDVKGLILLANQHAIDYFDKPSAPNSGTPTSEIGVPENKELRGRPLLELLERLHAPQPVGQAGNISFRWRDLLDLQHADSLNNGVSARDDEQRDLLIKSAPCFSASNLQTGWIVSLIDISTMRAAERSRDETLRFLSHDMRAPQASILALLELQQEEASALPSTEFFSRIEKASRKTLGLADNFVQLARAESQEYRLEEVDFQDLLFDAIDEMWTLARSKNIRLVSDIAPGEFPILADRALMTRALTNLISNAINYSPENTEVRCLLTQAITIGHQRIICSICDQGPGIAEADQSKLFHRFQRLDQARKTRQDGIGLGLVFVKTVAERHQGNVTVKSELQKGSTFTMDLPMLEALV